MEFFLDRESQTPIYLQISNIIKEKILEHEFFDGYHLPSERKLSSELHVHRNTIIKAYENLIKEGLVVASRKSPRGYFVYRKQYSSKEKNQFFTLEKTMNYELDSSVNIFGDIYQESTREGIISFGGMVTSKDVYPKEQAKKIMQKFVDCHYDSLFEYCDPSGYEPLREHIASRLDKHNISAKNIQIISETLQGISYVAKIYLKEGDCVVAEEPIVPEVVNVFSNYGVKVVTVPMEEDGMNMVVLEEVLKVHRPRFIYTLPSFHIPTGILTSYEKHCKVLELAYKYNVPIIEEDSQSELYYTKNKIPTLYAMDEKRQVIYIDSFTFSFFPGAFMAYILAPYEVVDMVSRIIRMEQISINGISQHLLNLFFEDNLMNEHINDLRQTYKEKRDLMCECLEPLRQKGLEFTKPKGGILIWCKLPSGVNERKLYNLALEKGVLFMPGFLFFPYGNQGDGYIRLCFSNVSDEQIKMGIKIIEQSIDELLA